jgi:ribosomal protein S18 acetylase RimI-like enzyme
MLTKAKLSDLNEIDDLAVLVISDMEKSGIPQWKLNYPRYEHFIKDVEQDGLILYKENKKIIGCMAMLPENDPPYKTINSWLKEKSIVLHRILVHPEHRKEGIAKKLLDYAIKYGLDNHYESIKIDTHLDNYKMRKFLSKNNFIELEYIAVMDRFAYELVLEDNDE